MNKPIIGLIILISLIVLSCVQSDGSSSQEPTTSLEENVKEMNSFIAIFEIPATDISRANTFYQNILNIELQEFEFPGTQMGLFPTENQMNVGVILKAQDYVPSSNGITLYFNAGRDLQLILDKIEPNGGEIITPKTPHADGVGYFALFKDTEGNRIGLHSPE